MLFVDRPRKMAFSPKDNKVAGDYTSATLILGVSMKMKVFPLALALCLGAASQAHAATVVDTGPSSNVISWTLANSQWIGGGFSLSAATTLSSVEAYITDVLTAGDLTLAISQDTGAATPGAQLFSGVVNVSATGFRGLSGLNWALGPGNYFVTSSVLSGSTFSGTQGGNVANPLSREIFSPGTGEWFDYQLQSGWRITSGGVPEPVSWAMMITGFGFVGGAMRRRTTKLAAA